MTALLAKATALALAKHPVVNSSCRDGNSFVYNGSINIAVAVAIDGGLITPVLQNADKVLSFFFLFCYLLYAFSPVLSILCLQNSESANCSIYL